jgi:hypothetical protein
MRTSVRYWLILLLLLTQALGTAPVMAAPLRQGENLPLESPVELAVGDEILVGESPDGIYIFYGGVLFDKRCPVGETCEKAGNALFNVIVSSEDRQESAILEIGTAADQQITHFGGYNIELLSVDPSAPQPDENIVLIDYVLTLVVRSGGEATPKPEAAEEPTAEEASQDEQGASAEPIMVDRCVNFTPFDAAAVLQEAVNATEPIGNILFGPLPSDLVSEPEMLQGLCGYAASAPAAEKDRSQTHIATAINAAHAVAAQHLTADTTYNANGTVQSDIFALMLLAEAMGAANPNHDSEELFNVLYNFAGHFPLLEVLQYDAEQAPSFQVQALEPTTAEGYEELFWFWQSLEDGYFSLLVGRTGLDFDLVAARLGSHVREPMVQGYSRVILNKLLTPASNSDTGGATSAGAVGCDLLTLDEVEGILQDAVDMQAVANEEGDGCKYTYVDDAQSIDPADFSNGFESNGLLVGVVPPKAAQTLLNAMIEELSTTGNVQDGDALQAILDALQAEDWSDTLTQIAALAWDSSSWQVEAMSEVSDDTLFITGRSGSGWPQFFLLRPHADGGVYLMMGLLPMEIEDVRAAIATAAQNLSAQEKQAQDEPSEAPTTQPTEKQADESSGDCTLVDAQTIAAMLGEAVDSYAVAGERGTGCKYIPQGEGDWVEADDFTPTFESHGVLAGVMPPAGAQWLLEELVATLPLDEESIAALQQKIEDGQIKAALQELATLESQAEEWTITALPIVSDDTLEVYSDSMIEGYRLTFFFRSRGDGELVMVAVQLPADRDVEAMQVAAIAVLQALGEE